MHTVETSILIYTYSVQFTNTDIRQRVSFTTLLTIQMLRNSSTPLYNASNKHFSFLKSLNIFLGYFNSCPENYLTQFRLVNKLANQVVRKGRFIRLSDNRINMDYCLVWYSLISLTRTVILCHYYTCLLLNFQIQFKYSKISIQSL